MPAPPHRASPRRDPGLSPGAVAGVIVVVVVVVGCSGCIVEREFPEEDVVDVAAPLEVPPFGRPVQVVASYPPDGALEVPIDTVLWFELDQYLEPEALTATGTLRVQSGGVFASVQVQYEMVGRRLVGRLRAPLQPDFEYIMTLDPTRIVAVDGSPMLVAPTVRFRTGDWRSQPGVVETAAPSWAADVEPILERGCGCHRLDPVPEPWFELPALSHARVVGQFSASEPGLRLVEPGDATHSVLMRRLLPDFPRRQGLTPMPPPWAGEVERTRDLAHAAPQLEELRRIEAWIQAGAPP